MECVFFHDIYQFRNDQAAVEVYWNYERGCNVMIHVFAAIVTVFLLASNGVGRAAAGVDSSHREIIQCEDIDGDVIETGFEGNLGLRQSRNGDRASFLGDLAERVDGVRLHGSVVRGVKLGTPDIQYQGGSARQRSAEIVKDLTDPGNRVLAFRLQHANVRATAHHPSKGRIQMNVYRNSGVRVAVLRVRMFLHEDMRLLRSYPNSFDWLTLSEWWNNAGWTGEEYPFRVKVDLVKPSDSMYSNLNFKVQAQTKDSSSKKWKNVLWERINRDFSVPMGTWVTLEYLFQEGDAETGRFYLSVTPDGGLPQVIFDVVGYTHHPEDLDPDGLSHVNPVKIYTSKELIDHVRNGGGALEVHWDDLQLLACASGVGRH